VEQVVQGREKLLFRRIPGLHQVVVNFSFVDSIDGGVGVGVSGEQCTFGLGMNVHGLGEKSNAIHAGHALVGQEQSHGIVSRFELAQGAQRGAAGIGAHHAVLLGIVAAQVALDGAQHFRIVINGQ
jgi:hypothetical protein